MAEWDHRAATGNGAYQMYLYVREDTIDSSGPGTTYLHWEVGIIKVGSSGGFASSQGNCPYEVRMHGNNNGDATGSGAFSFTAGAAIGTRDAVASIGTNGWSFTHNSSGDGRLTLATFAKLTTGISIGTPQIGWGNIAMTSTSRTGAAPAAPSVQARPDSTHHTIRCTQSTDWGTGTGAVMHNLDRSKFSNFTPIELSTTVTTVAGGGHVDDVSQTIEPYTTYYYRYALQSRNGAWAISTPITVYDRPSKPDAPTLSTATQTTLSFTLPAPSYVGGGVTARETQISTSPTFASILATDTTNTPSFGSLTRVTTYYVRSRQQNSVSWSDWSDTVTAGTVGTLPAAPTGYSVYDIAATSATVSLGSLSDNGGAAPDAVRVKVSTTASDAGLVSTITESEWTPVRLSGLTKGTTYYISEGAHNAVAGGGWGPYGAWVPFTTSAIVPNAPVLSLNSASGTTAVLQWTTPSQLNGAVIVEYHLLVARNAGLTTNTREFVVPAGANAQVVDALIPATQYYATVWTVTDKGLGSSSAVLAFSSTGGGGSTSGVWIDVGGVPKFAEVWLDVAGVPRLTEVWIDVSGIPELAGS